MDDLRNIDKEHIMLENRIKEMDEENAIIKALMSRLAFHALHMKKNLPNVTSTQMFSNMFNKINIILSKYVTILVEVSCKLEMALYEGVRNWNHCYSSTNFTIKPLPSASNYIGKSNRSKIEKWKKNLSAKQLLKSNKKNCMQNITDDMENLLNHQQFFSNGNLTTDKVSELAPSNDSVSENSVAINKKEFSIDEFNLAKLSVPNCYGHIQHAFSPSELYVYFATEDIFLMEELDKEISALSKDEEFKSSGSLFNKRETNDFSKRKTKAMEELGDYALYISEAENLFYRAKIIDWNMSSENDVVNLFLIDHGIKMDVSLYNVYPMPENWKKYPAFAVRCHLLDVVSENDEIEWTPVEIQILNKWVKENDEVMIVIDEKESKIKNSLPIRVYNVNQTESLNNLIRESRSIGKGIELSENENEAMEKILNDWNPMKEAYDSHLNSYDIHIDHPSIPVYRYIPKDDNRLCKIFRETGKCYKGDGCRKEHEMMDKRGYTTDKEEIYTNSFNCLNQPKIGDVLNVHVTYIPNGCEFYCVQEPSKKDSEEETLDSLVNYMNIDKNVNKMKKLKIPPSPGQVVACKFSQDNYWYRAKVLEVNPEDDEFVVFFVDYGNTETVNLSCMREIQPQYLHLPFQVMLCKIDGIQIKPEAEEEAVKFLDDNMPRSVQIKVKATYPGEKPHLVVKLSSDKHRNIGILLLKKKYAEPKKNCILNESLSILPG